MRRHPKRLVASAIAVAASLGAASGANALEPLRPIVGFPGDFVVGDGVNGATPPATQENNFVYPDGLDLLTLALDGDTAPGDIRWSYVVAGTYRLNGVEPLDTMVDDPINPPANKQLNLNDLDSASQDGVPQTVTIRNVDLSPDDGSGPPYAPPSPDVDGIVAGQTQGVTLIASDSTTFTIKSFLLLTTNNEDDRINLEGFRPMAFNDFQDGDANGWSGFDPNNSSLPGSGEVSFTASGLCMSVPGPGTNQVLWLSPERFVELVDLAVYRIRSGVSSDQMDPDAIPFFNVVYDNFNTSMTGNNYNGQILVFDNNGGANGIGRPQGISTLDFYGAPASLALPQWRDTATGAFSPAADSGNDMRVMYRILDMLDMTNGDADSGAIYVQNTFVQRAPFTSFTRTMLWGPPIQSSTHFAETFDQASLAEGVAMIDDGNSAALYQLIDPVSGSTRKTLGPFDPSQSSPNSALYPVVWNSNELLLGGMDVVAAVGGPTRDPVDFVGFVLDVPTNEIGITHGVSRGAPGDMHFAGSPRTDAEAGGAAQTYWGFMFTQNATLGTGLDANRARVMGDFFNTDAVGPEGAGTDPFAVRNLRLYRADIPME